MTSAAQNPHSSVARRTVGGKLDCFLNSKGLIIVTDQIGFFLSFRSEQEENRLFFSHYFKA